MPTQCNLVLLLVSGHTVRIILDEGELAGNGGATPGEMVNLAEGMPAIVQFDENQVILAYVENPEYPHYNAKTHEFEPRDDFQRIDVLSPGDAGDRS